MISKQLLHTIEFQTAKHKIHNTVTCCGINGLSLRGIESIKYITQY